MDALRARIAPLLTSYSGADVDPLTGSFSADHTGLDQFFDDVTVTITSGVATIARTFGRRGAVPGPRRLHWGAAWCPSNWSAAEALIAYDPETVVDANGNAIVVWVQDDGSHWNVHARRFSSSTGWADAAMIATAPATRSCGDRVWTARGTPWPPWYQWNGSKSRIHAARFTTADGWESPVILDDDGGGRTTPPFASDAVGDCVVVWHQLSVRGPMCGPHVTLRRSGWSAAEVLTTR